MRVCADKRVRIREVPPVPLSNENGLGKVLEIDLMNDSNVRRHDAAILECLLSPL